jgi:hypothetical protein
MNSASTIRQHSVLPAPRVSRHVVGCTPVAQGSGQGLGPKLRDVKAPGSSQEKAEVTRVQLKRVELTSFVQSDDVLKASGLLRSLDRTGVRSLLEASVTRRFPSGSTLFQQGDAGQSLFFILRGQVRLVCAEQGEQVDLGTLHRGDVFGEHEALALAQVRASSALAVNEVDVAEAPAAIVQQLVHGQPALYAYLRELQEQRRSQLDEMSSFLNRW